MSDTPQTLEEQPKDEVAKRVITNKRKYFFPTSGASIEAKTHEEAVVKFQKQLKAKDGDV